MDLDLSQLPKLVNGGPMYVFVPETTGDEEYEYVDAPGEPESVATPTIIEAQSTTGEETPAPALDKQQVAATIRQVADPAVAKRVIDEKILTAATANRARAEHVLRSLKIPYRATSVAMSGLWSWLSGTSKLSNLDLYSPEQREQLRAFLQAPSFDVIEKTYKQEELDAVLTQIRAGATTPSGAAPLVDPYSTAAKAYQAEVVSALAPLGTTAAAAGGNAAGAVGAGIVKMYQQSASNPGRDFDWLGRAKWAVGLAVVGIGGYFLWPKVRPYLEQGSGLERASNAVLSLMGRDR